MIVSVRLPTFSRGALVFIIAVGIDGAHALTRQEIFMDMVFRGWRGQFCFCVSLFCTAFHGLHRRRLFGSGMFETRWGHYYYYTLFS